MGFLQEFLLLLSENGYKSTAQIADVLEVSDDYVRQLNKAQKPPSDDVITRGLNKIGASESVKDRLLFMAADRGAIETNIRIECQAIPRK